jgi:hypothetical protein
MTTCGRCNELLNSAADVSAATRIEHNAEASLFFSSIRRDSEKWK